MDDGKINCISCYFVKKKYIVNFAIIVKIAGLTLLKKRILNIYDQIHQIHQDSNTNTQIQIRI